MRKSALNIQKMLNYTQKGIKNLFSFRKVLFNTLFPY
jgi:hypothetical protein